MKRLHVPILVLALAGTLAAPQGAAATTGTASWYADGPGLYGAVHSYRWGHARYRVAVAGPAGRAVVVIRDHCLCRVNGKVRLIDLSPAAFRRVCGPLSRGLCNVRVTG